MSIQKLSGSKACKAGAAQEGDVTPCQPIKPIVYMSASRQIMGLICSYVLTNLVLCILLCIKIIVQVQTKCLE